MPQRKKAEKAGFRPWRGLGNVHRLPTNEIGGLLPFVPVGLEFQQIPIKKERFTLLRPGRPRSEGYFFLK